MTELRFTKMHGLGNDFVVIDERGREPFPSARATALCDRHLGIGADGVLVIGAAGAPGALARMTVWNADGSRAEMCGNGIRCVALLLTSSGSVAIETDTGVRRCEVLADGSVEVDMGHAQIEGAADELFEVAGRALRCTRVRTGNPHLVTFDELGAAERARVAPAIERHARFPDGTNVEFATVTPAAIRIHVWERGVGFTRACGTGACATVAAACETGRARRGERQRVTLPGGDLMVLVPAGEEPIRMRGPATRVFEGSIDF